MSAKGIVRDLHVETHNSKGGAAPVSAVVFNVHKGGVSTNLAATVKHPNNTSNDLVNSFPVVAGDRISVHVSTVPPSTTQTVGAKVAFSFMAQ